MKSEIEFFNYFEKKVKELVQRTNDDPSRLQFLIDNSAEMRRLIGAIYFSASEFDTYVKSRAYLAVPTWFLQTYRDYERRYAEEISRTYGRLHLRVTLDGDEVPGISAEEIAKPDPNRPKLPSKTDWVPATDLIETEAFEFLLRWAWEMHDSSDHAENLRAGLDAWDHFESEVGINLDEIELRWLKLPRILIPRRPGSMGNPGARGALLDLLNDAVRAYMFGAPAAAIAMCRAICEMVLKELYLGNGNGRAPQGGKLILLAERQFEAVRKLRLRHHTDLANRVLHDLGRAEAPGSDLDKAVVDFLATLKTLIEQSPPSAALPD